MIEHLVGNPTTEPWSARVRTLARNGHHREALALLRHNPSPPPCSLALPSLLLSCAALSLLSPILQLHTLSIKSGLLPSSDAYLLSSLLSSYCRLHLLPFAHQLFDEMFQSPVTPPSTLLTASNALISGYSFNTLPSQALELFRQMRREGLRFDAVTLLALLPSTSPHFALSALHACAFRSSFIAVPAVANCLLSSYARLGAVELARKIFDEICPEKRDLVSWNAMVSAYAQNGLASEVLELYQQMVGNAGVKPDEVTLVGVLSSCAHLGARSFGNGVERYVLSGKPSFRANVFLQNALINFHARCGELERAQEIFDRMPKRTIVSWTALIAGYGMHGHGDVAVELFERMRMEGMRPDGIAIVSVLSACSHGGMTDKGMEYFDAMEKVYGIKRTPEHYACMVDLLGRAGRLKDAQELIESMAVEADGAVWGALLGACKIHKDVEIGELAFDRVIELEPTNVGYYVLMSNIYSDAERLDGVARIRAMMRKRGLKKEPGCSYIEHKGKVHLFMADDHSHPQAKRIYESVSKLEALVKRDGEADVKKDEGKKETPMTGFHSEKLAVAFGLLNTEAGAEIVVIKNLRVCEDCHSFLKAISKIVNRSFLVRDASRFHRFREGECSCKDYW
ncbi:putative pentatricopeptide repeat-containing protein At3g11460, mitochondrial [Typha angustifolia]|uniref:putative pentatricopeptide repeat-containing protein At3g11460, mitochondrial n=1 Tax=Typha angustifolia TaxID=59011 RepID=UPI003C304849